MHHLLILLSFLIFSTKLFAYNDPKTPLEKKVAAYIDEIKSKNPNSNKKINFRTGLLQVVSNIKGIQLNADNTMAAVALETQWEIYKNFGFEARALLAQNSVYQPINDMNKSDKNMVSFDVGGRYVWEFDPTRKGNYFAAKLLFHSSSNNFELEDSSEEFLMSSYSGILGGVERAIPITKEIAIEASLDGIIITDSTHKSSLDTEKNGFGLQVRGELFYIIGLLAKRDRIGIAYWQSAFNNEFTDSSKEDRARKSFVQTFRMISISYGFLF